MTDNYQNLEHILNFDFKHPVVYRIQIMKRRKDSGNEDMKTGQSVIEFIYLYSLIDYLKKEDYIKQTCVDNNARAYLEINPKYVYSVGLAANKLMLVELYHRENIADEITQGYRANIGKSIFNVCDLLNECLLASSEKETGHLINRSFSMGKNASKRWILDVDYNDDIDEERLPEIIKIINGVGLDFNKQELNVFINPTKNGSHLIFDPSNLHVLNNRLNNTFGLSQNDIKKDNATLLYF